MNRKSFILAVLASVMSVTAFAQSYANLYKNLPVQIKQVTDVNVPDLKVNATKFGAVADGKTLNTEAFAKAIQHLKSKGGGHLILTKGVWMSGPIELFSNIDLHLEKGAVLKFSTDKSLYYKEGDKRFKAMISAKRSENVMITGKGVIDGQGEYWRPVKKSKVSEKEWSWYTSMGGTIKKDLWMPYNLNNGIPSVGESAEKQETMRNHLVQITDSKNVMVKGVTLKNSPKFHLVPTRCQNLIVDGVTVDCPWYAQNGDAIDPGNVQTALIVGCTISCGDDGICMKGGVGDAGVAAGPNSDFLIQDNTVYRAHGGFVIGSEFCAGMHRLIVRRCKFIGTDIGLRFKSAPGRGGTCSDIYCYDIDMKDIRNEAILWQTSYADQGAVVSATAGDDKSKFYPDFCNMTIYNVKVQGAKVALRSEGLDGFPVHDMKLSDIEMTGCQSGVIMKNSENFIFKDCKIKSKKSNTIDSATCRNISWK